MVNENIPENRSQNLSDGVSPNKVTACELLSTQELAGVYDFGSKLKRAAEEALTAAIGQEVSIHPATIDCLSGAGAMQGLEGGYFIEGVAKLSDDLVLPWLMFIEEKDAAILDRTSSAQTTPDTPAGEAVIERLKGISGVIVEEANRILKSENNANELSLSSTRLGNPSELMSLAFEGGMEVVRVSHKLELAGNAPCRVTSLFPRQAIRHLAADMAGEDEGPGPSSPASADFLNPNPQVAAEQLNYPANEKQPSTRMAQFVPLSASQKPSSPNSIDILLDVSLRISVELGRVQLPIREVLELGPGSVVELDKLAGEPVDILANDRVIAKGEVVVVDENFGVRITDILAPSKRL